MEIYGGRAGYNSVRFTGEKYQAISRFKKGEITTETRVKKRDKKIFIALSKIPFVRSFSMLVELIIENWKPFSLVFTLFLMEFLLFRNANSYTIPINTFVMLACYLILAGLIIKITPIGKYHAAEHMAASAYEKDSNLTLGKVKKQPRTHKDCGTNLVISIFICYSILFMIFGDPFWVYLISWSVGYELWKNEPKIIWDTVLVIGKAAQYALFTSKPKEKHLVVAIEAITKLEEKELASH
ncbi:uncharacterized protein YqhQ [Virgibacillus natechei]|uniref:Uncharacterized protein YqhQ n=1 Tax=Virgibacillus natechei TaxID=1216297 RepID=A0ABS4IG84_9BACI|nr:DUF1385 domain-containing protein [Virgibacillus natechei]MBP1969947.1 uncharacterized protein YqhQ [Virgibacillus natechei]UZD13391.1 DUF1385 domain-containing protein [Virgibacillus natechei]